MKQQGNIHRIPKCFSRTELQTFWNTRVHCLRVHFLKVDLVFDGCFISSLCHCSDGRNIGGLGSPSGEPSKRR